VVRRRTIFELNKARAKAHTLLGLSVAVGNLDEIIKTIKESETPEAAKIQLTTRGWLASDISEYIKLIDDPNTDYRDGLFYMSEEQAKAILELRLNKLTGLEREKIHSDLVDLGEQIRDYLEILKDKNRITDIIRDETSLIRNQYSHARRTEISDQECDIDIEDLIAREDMVVTVSNTGYIKRVPLNTYRAQKRGGKGRNAMTTKEEDFVANMFVANTHTPLIFFSNKGIAYRLKTYKLPMGVAAGKGKPLVNLLPLQSGEIITKILPQTDAENISLMFVTSTGNVRRNKVSDFENIRTNGKIAMKLDEGEILIDVLEVKDTDDLFISTKLGRCIRFPVPEVRVFASRDSNGIRGVKLMDKDEVISTSVLSHFDYTPEERAAYIKQSRALRRAETGIEEEETVDTEDAAADITISDEKFAEMQAREQFILTVSQNGFGKRSSAFEYRTTHRGVGGYAAIKLGGKNTAVAASFPVVNDMDIMMVTDGGKIIRTPVSDIRIAGRATAGVTLFRLDDKEKIVSAISIEKEEESDEVTDETIATDSPAEVEVVEVETSETKSE
jgi:DNA gyrase subunit A